MPDPQVSFSIVAKNAAGRVLGEVDADLARVRGTATTTRTSMASLHEEGARGQNIFTGFSGRLEHFTEAGHGASRGMMMVKRSIAETALESVGAHNTVGRLAEGLFLFSAGSAPLIAVSAGIIGIAALYEHLGGSARDATEDIQKLTDANLKFVEQQGRGVGAIAGELFQPSEEDKKKKGDKAKSLMEQKADAERVLEAAQGKLQGVGMLRAFGFGGKEAKAVEEAEGNLAQITLRVNQLLHTRGETLLKNEIADQKTLIEGELGRIRALAAYNAELEKMPVDRFPALKMASGQDINKGELAVMDSLAIRHASPKGLTDFMSHESGREEKERERITKEHTKEEKEQTLATKAATHGVLAMAQALASGQNAAQAFSAGLAQALPGLIKGPWGVVLGGAAGLLGSLFRKHESQPVHVASMAPEAAQAISDAMGESGPRNVTIGIFSPTTGELLDELQVELANRTASDYILRMPRGVPLPGRG